METIEERRQHRAEYQRHWREQNPERVRENRQRWLKKNPERAAKSHQRWLKKQPGGSAGYRRRWKEKNPERVTESRRRSQEKEPANRLKQKYGITLKKRADMARIQKNRCAICRKNSELVVDHCHATRRVRGLLCRKCNYGLGCFGDSPVTLRAAIKYLAKRMQTHVQPSH